MNLMERALPKGEDYLKSLMTLLTIHLWQSMDGENSLQMKAELIRFLLLFVIFDVFSYIVNMCIIDKIKDILIQISRDPLRDLQESVPPFVERAVEFLEAISAFSPSK